MAIAILASVTVSMALETSGTFSMIRRDSRVAVATSPARRWTAGSRTSSKVSRGGNPSSSPIVEPDPSVSAILARRLWTRP
jgi:hypothetical protein